ncbi:MAG TPA: hypothetical protein VJO53_08225 [Candidatus Acidoferrales bacterium]|nr:hypothetical protein [Candidatus Acidoferrales bacterium]
MRTGEAIWLGIALCLFAYITWRIWQWSTRYRWSRTLLLPSSQLSWRGPASDRGFAPFQESSASRDTPGATGEKRASDSRKRRSSARARQKALAAAGIAAADGAVATFAAAATLAGVDLEVLRAIQASTAEDLGSVNSVSDYVRAKFHDISAASPQAWMQRLEDYAAEQRAVIALEKAGHAVQLHADQAGWRWLVDGRPLEVKEGVASIAGAKEAVSDLRMAAKSKRDMIHGLPDFDHDAIGTASKDAISVIHEGLDPGLHFPLGTLLRSAWRELELLFDKKTPIERAVKHVAMDVASVGTGAYIGAKVGGGLGAMAGPLGVGAGLLVGAMAGAIAGRGLAHKSRMAPFSKAYERYETTLSSARSGVDGALAESKAEIKEMGSQYQAKFEAIRTENESAAQQRLEEIERKQSESLRQFLRQFPDYLGALEAQLLHDEAAVLGAIPSRRWWNWIFPRRLDLEKSITRKWFKRTKKIVKKERRRFEKVKESPAPALQPKVHHFLNTYTFSLNSFDEALGTLSNEFTEACASAEMIKHASLCEVEGARDEMLADFRGRVSKMYLALCRTISGWREKVQVSLDDLRNEASPLGIELPE